MRRIYPCAQRDNGDDDHRITTNVATMGENAVSKTAKQKKEEKKRKRETKEHANDINEDAKSPSDYEQPTAKMTTTKRTNRSKKLVLLVELNGRNSWRKCPK